jgi:hypothetical protein
VRLQPAAPGRLAEFEALVSEHKIHYFVGASAHSFGGESGDASAITKWVASHFQSRNVGGEIVYNLTEPNGGCPEHRQPGQPPITPVLEYFRTARARHFTSQAHYHVRFAAFSRTRTVKCWPGGPRCVVPHPL